MSLESPNCTLEDVLTFIRQSKCMSVSYTEKGYKVYAYRSQEEKWNSPHCIIWITNCLIPKDEFKVTVEYRKEEIFCDQTKKTCETIIQAISSQINTLEAERRDKMKQEFLDQNKIK